MIESSDLEYWTALKGLFARIRVPNSAKLASFGFGVILLSWLAAQLDFAQAVEILRDVPPGLLAGGFGCYVVAFYLRAVRFQYLLPPESSKALLFPIVLVHYAALNIIPARLGELSYIYLLKKVNNVSTGTSVSNLLLARVFDQLTMSVLFLASSYALQLSSPWLQAVRLGVSLLLMAMGVLLLLLLAYKDVCIRWLQRVFQFLHVSHYAGIRKVIGVMGDIVTALGAIQVKQRAVRVAGLSVLIWLSIFGQNYCLLHAFQVDLSYAGVIWASTCLILLSALPIHMFSGVGIHEISWVFLALELGIPKNIAITSAFGSRLISILFLVGLGGSALFRLYPILSHSSAVTERTAEVRR